MTWMTRSHAAHPAGAGSGCQYILIQIDRGSSLQCFRMGRV